MSPQSRWLLHEPAFLFAFLSRQRSPWLFMTKKDLFLIFCVKGDRLVLFFYHKGTVPCISCGGHQDVLWVPQGESVDVSSAWHFIVSLREWFDLFFSVYIKKPQMDNWEVIWGRGRICHICPMYWTSCQHFAFMIMMHLYLGGSCALSVDKQHLLIFVCLAYLHLCKNNMHPKTQRIKDACLFIPQIKLLRMLVPVCLVALVPLRNNRSVIYRLWPFRLLIDNKCGTWGALLLWLLVLYTVSLHIHL